jgi:hypothetical protein
MRVPKHPPLLLPGAVRLKIAAMPTAESLGIEPAARLCNLRCTVQAIPEGGRRRWKMTDLTQKELAHAIVHDAVRKYIATRRECIDPFVDRHFTLAGSLALHRQAIGWDLLRAPANLFLAGPALSVKLASWAARRAGNHRLAAWLGGRRLLVETDVACDVE